MKLLATIIIVIGMSVGAWFLLSQQNEPVSAPQATVTPTTPSTIIPSLPVPQKTTSEEPKPSNTPTVPSSEDTSSTNMIPASVVLKDVHFASQAPLKNWDYPYQEFCEEAASLIAAFYALGKTIPGPDGVNAELFRIKEFEEKEFGFYEDTTAQETTRILKEFYGLTDVTLMQNPSLEDIKSQLAQGKAIMVPTAGRMLGNPYFKAPGPLYHMIVLKGYTSSGYFITQDPGTNTKGENY
ncbi:MAG: C39 family peptidase, partial [Patescibacteria group bacterium]